jgi:hypothetical protein
MRLYDVSVNAQNIVDGNQTKINPKSSYDKFSDFKI